MTSGSLTAPTVFRPARRIVIATLGVTQILAWGSTYYLLAVLARPIARDTGWPLSWVVGGLSLGLLVAALISPRVGASIERYGGRPVLALSAVAIGIGQVGLAIAPNLATHMFAWLIVGVGMGAGLYDAAFGTLGWLYERDARAAITTLTLFGGLRGCAGNSRNWPETGRSALRCIASSPPEAVLNLSGFAGGLLV